MKEQLGKSQQGVDGDATFFQVDVMDFVYSYFFVYFCCYFLVVYVMESKR